MKQSTEFALHVQLAKLYQALAQAAVDNADDFSIPEIIDMADASVCHFAEDCAVNRQSFAFRDACKNGIEMIKRIGTGGGSASGRSTGFASLDERIDGLCDGELIIIAGRPGVGKASLAASIACNVASKPFEDFNSGNESTKSLGASVAYFSLKITADQVAIRILAQQTGTSLDVLCGGKDGGHLAALASEAQRLANLPLYIEDNAAPTIMRLCARASTLKRRHDIGLIVVDCVQLVRTTYGSADSIAGISEVCRRLKALAGELSLPVIALFDMPGSSQDFDDEGPQVSDLRKWGRVEADADAIWLLDRQTGPRCNLRDHFGSAAQTDPKAEDYSLVSLVIAMKYRRVTERVKLHLHVPSGRFSDPSGERS